MGAVLGIVLLTDLLPLVRAIRANWGAPLVHALFWVLAAWLGWAGVVATQLFFGREAPASSWLALALTGCAGMAVLGARRPGAGAWHFVVLALLAILLLPLAQGWGKLRIHTAWIALLAGATAVIPFNYLPTRLGLAALALAAGCGVEMAALAMSPDALGELVDVGRLLVALSPWIGWALLKSRRPARSEADCLWVGFRDRYGLTWGLRTREQFNRTAANAGWTSRLGWRGLHGSTCNQIEEEKALRALLKRFCGSAGSGPKEEAC
jgi:hypothetical protein